MVVDGFAKVELLASGRSVGYLLK
ncbi:MAG: hypothetical protein QOG37_2995, partial [Mycobacterium sp.]|nr:hypothetical protein [Mycobacterium sp.]